MRCNRFFSLFLEVGFEHVLLYVARLCQGKSSCFIAHNRPEQFLWSGLFQKLIADCLSAVEPISDRDFVTKAVIEPTEICQHPKYLALLSFLEEVSQSWRSFRGEILMDTAEGTKILAHMLQMESSAKGKTCLLVQLYAIAWCNVLLLSFCCYQIFTSLYL